MHPCIAAAGRWVLARGEVSEACALTVVVDALLATAVIIRRPSSTPALLRAARKVVLVQRVADCWKRAIRTPEVVAAAPVIAPALSNPIVHAARASAQLAATTARLADSFGAA